MRWIFTVLAFAFLLEGKAQEYPSKPIRLI